jgi:hypothetical protein
MVLGYCGNVKEQTILHVLSVTYSCTPTMAGASRVIQSGVIVNGNGSYSYWNTPSSFTGKNSSGAAINGPYSNVAGPAGTVVQTVDINNGSIIWVPGDSGSTAGSTIVGATGGGSWEGWIFACPNTHPTISAGTVAAYGETNPSLIQCQ